MAAVNKTYSELFTFINVATKWLKDNKDESKLRYAVKKVMKSCDKLITSYQEKVEDLNIEHCSEDENGIIRKDAQGGFQFTKDNLRKRNAAMRKLQDEKVEVPSFFADHKDDLSDSEVEAFTGFVIEPAPVVIAAVKE